MDPAETYYTWNSTGSGEKGEKEISTANVPVSTAGPEVSTASTDVSTAAAALVYIRRSASKAKEKGKGIMTEPEPPKKLKKRVQVQLTIDEDLAKKLFEEERARFNAEQEARAKEEQEQEMSDFEVAQELQRQLDERQEVLAKPNQAHKIDWNDPGVLRYHAQLNRQYSVAEVRRNMIMYLKNQAGYKQRYFKGMTYKDIRPIFEKVWDQVNTFVPMGSELEKESSKESLKPVEEDVEPQQVMKESSTKSEGRIRKSLPRKRARKAQDEEKTKKQKHEDDAEKEELRLSLKIVLDEDKDMDYEVLDMKYPIVEWESQILGNFGENEKHVYKITRADGNSKYYLNISRMLETFDRDDGDLKVLVDPKEDDNIWKNQQEWKMISWKLYETCGVHSLMVDGTLLTIHMFVEKKYPLTKETLEKMLNWRLEYNVSTAIVNFVLPEEVNTAEDVEDKDV
ncbi:putative reverse transcriptase domain-containing protein [Tanacetum coccineum]|uniref:Reverse transcriptase domain-containing protein n=1 Tax=Tanacetum coccineum TaxID=301880 RepID=A0ABQ5H9Y3_9ASTR